MLFQTFDIHFKSYYSHQSNTLYLEKELDICPLTCNINVLTFALHILIISKKARIGKFIFISSFILSIVSLF